MNNSYKIYASEEYVQEQLGSVGSSVEVDSTLTQSGQAADAKVTGDALTNLQTNINTLESEIDEKLNLKADTADIGNAIITHNTTTDTHNDIRVLISDLTTKLNNFLDVDDTTSDQLSEVLALIDNNKDTLDSLTTNKVNVSDIINNLTTNNSGKVLSAAQGVAIKALIDALQEELDSHIDNTSNPHNVTLSQLGITATAAELNIMDGITATTTELNYVDGVTSNIQTQLNGKAASSHGNHVPATQTASNKVFLRNDNTWQTITPANIGAAASSHGNHVPATETANNAKFLRNDNTWQTVTPANIGAAASSHGTHVSYGTTASALGTSSAGSATTVSRSDHVHALPALTSCTGTLTVAKGGTGATTFTSGAALIGAGTGAVTTRTIRNNTATSGAVTADTALITSNTLRYAINRTTSVAAADANYTTYMARGTSLNSAETTPTVNGTIAWTYE